MYHGGKSLSRNSVCAVFYSLVQACSSIEIAVYVSDEVEDVDGETVMSK
jgi:hypothetical protein